MFQIKTKKDMNCICNKIQADVSLVK